MSNQLKKSLVLLFFAVSILQAQQQKEVQDIESIYLHTDRECYTLGESLWYKAYSVYPYNNLLYNKSSILYVELVSPESKVIIQNKTRLENGIGNGDFKLEDSLGVKKPGIYQLRAYTNWNRNFDDHFVFKKEIEILNISNRDNYKAPETAKAKKLKKSDLENQKPFSVQFFAEGGSLIEDINNTIAFKAVDKNGLPLAVKGEIYTSKDSLVTLFGTIHEGMGKFQLNPKASNGYYAKVSTKNGDENLKIPLPKVREEGYVLSFRKIGGKEMLNIKTNNKTILSQKNEPVKVINKFKGVTYFEIEQTIASTMVWFELPKDKLPGGINQITLYDASTRPQSERLIYIDKSTDIDITLSTDKKIYQPNEKVTVTLSSKTKTGAPLLASYSLSSIDLNGLEDKGLAANICSHYLMEADIRGEVFNPGFYFNKNNRRRFEKLDLLLLTQGWRDFLWKEMPSAKESQTPFLSEQGIDLSGRVQSKFNKKPLVNNNITLTLFNNGKLNIQSEVTDASGRFKFQDIMFYGKSEMILSSKDNKGKGKGAIFMDKTTRSSLPVTFNPQILKKDTLQNRMMKDNVLRKYMSFGVMPENVLDEVELFGQRKIEEQPSIFGAPDRTFRFDEEKRNFSTIFQLIQSSIPGVIVSGSSIRFARFDGAAQIIVDGVPWQPEDVGFIQPTDVERIETITGAAASILGSNGSSNGALLIYLKEGATNRSNTVTHTIKQELIGFQEPRVFYSPDPNTISEENQKEDIRNTLYWNPYVHPDEVTGNVEVNYYNSAVETDVNVTIEGITATGIPVVVKTNYSIEE